MTRIGCRAHDYGKLPATALAATLRAKGYNAANSPSMAQWRLV